MAIHLSDFPARSLLTRACDGTTLRPLLQSAAEFHPFPTAAERPAWEALPADLRAAMIATGEKRLPEPWEMLPATVLLGYVRTGNRRDFETPMFARRSRLRDLVLAECAENRGRFLDAIADGSWLLCEESSWSLPACLFMQRRGDGLPDVTEPVVDLIVGETAALLAWTHYLLGEKLDAVHPMIRERIRLEIDRRVLTPCLIRDDFWWMGWHRDGRHVNNWNPWTASNWLTCALLLETDPDRRVRAVHKVMRIIDIFIDYASPDGGCDEGPGYWSRAAASLIDCLELLRAATGGQIDHYGDPIIRAMGRFVLHTHLHGPLYVNFADASMTAHLEPAIVHLYGRRTGDADLAAFGAWLFHQRPPHADLGGSLGRVLPALWLQDELRGAPAAAPLLRDVWLPHLQVMVARDAAGTGMGFFVAAKGGHNHESGHNHNDCGSFLAALDGWPLLIDLGVESYTAKTFSPQRYEIWTMQSQWHNLPTVNGVMQADGREFAARDVVYRATDAEASLSLDLVRAYPAAAAIVSWHRTIELQRGRAVVITDNCELSEARTPTVFNFITTRPLDLGTPGLVRFGAFPSADSPSRGASLAYDATALSAAVDRVEVTDAQLRGAWGPVVFRLRLTERTLATAARREFKITA